MANSSNLKPFRPGQSGNPGGRPKGIAAKAREHGDKALQVLVDGLADDDIKTRLIAAREILDRGYGKPVAMTADVTSRLGDMDDDTLNSAIDAIRAASGAAGEADSGTGAQTAH